MAKTKAKKKREKEQKKKTTDRASKVKSCYADIDNIHTNVAVLFEIAKENESKICIGKAHEIYTVHQELIKRKKKLRQTIDATIANKNSSLDNYVLRSTEISKFMVNNNFKCFNDKKYRKKGTKKSGSDSAYLNDLVHVYTMEESLNMRQAYVLTKEILKLKDVRIKDEVLRVKNKVFK